MPEGNSGGKLVDDRSHMGWDSGRVMVHMAYFRHACWSRIAGGGSDASISIGIIIIIVHYMLAASRLLHSIVQDLGIQPIFNFSSPQFLGIQFSEVLLFLLLFYPLNTGRVLPVLSEVQSKRK